MIAPNEPEDYASEVPFQLPLAADPLTGLTGYGFSLGEVTMRLPGAGAWINAATGNIVEKGYGRFAVRLTPLQRSLAGLLTINAEVSGTQPYRGNEIIGTQGGDIPVGGTGYMMFYLADAVDPIYAPPATGVFSSLPGALFRVCWPDATYVDGDAALVVGFGNGQFGYPVTALDSTKRGKAYFYAEADNYQPFESYITILTASEVAAIPATLPQPPVVVTPIARPTAPVATYCWSGSSSPFETRLLLPLPSFGLEALRTRFLFFVTDNHAPDKSARAVLQMAFETEIKALLVKLITLPGDVAQANVCERRRFIDIDQDMTSMRFLVEPALSELADTPNVPVAYVNTLRRYIASDHPRYRTCAIAAALCLAVAVLNP